MLSCSLIVVVCSDHISSDMECGLVSVSRRSGSVALCNFNRIYQLVAE